MSARSDIGISQAFGFGRLASGHVDGLVVLTRDVVDAGDGWVSVECGVAAVVVVGVEEACQGYGAFLAGGVGPPVGPLVKEGAVEAFDLAVGLRPVGADLLVGDAGRGQGLGEQLGLVAGAVIGQDAIDGDALVREERVRPFPESDGGVLAFVGQDFAVGQAGVVVDGGVDVAVADRGGAASALVGGGLAVAVAGCAADDAPAAVGDVAELLDVDVDQLARSGSFVAADDPAGGPVHEGQAVAAVPHEDPVDRRGGQPQDRTDAGRPQLAFGPQAVDVGLGRCRCAMRGAGGTAGAVVQSGVVLGPPSTDPCVGCGPGYAHLGRHMRDRAVRQDTFDQDPPAVHGQAGITV